MEISIAETVGWAAPDCDGLIPAEALVRLLKAGATGPITYDSGVWSFAGSSIPSLPIAEYPPVATASGWPATWQIDAATLRNMLARVAVCMSTEDTRYYLCGVYLHVVNGELRAVATDGHRLGLVAMPAPAGSEPMPGVIVPASTVKILLALLPKAGACTVSVSPTRICVACGTTTIVSKLIDGTFPDYPSVVPKRTKKEVTFRNPDMATAIKAVIATASDKAPTIATVFDSLGACRVECRTDGAASARDVECSGTIADMTIGANSRYWLQLLGQLGDIVTLNVTDARTPMLVSDDGVTFVLMPMRL